MAYTPSTYDEFIKSPLKYNPSLTTDELIGQYTDYLSQVGSNALSPTQVEEIKAKASGAAKAEAYKSTGLLTPEELNQQQKQTGYEAEEASKNKARAEQRQSELEINNPDPFNWIGASGEDRRVIDRNYANPENAWRQDNPWYNTSKIPDFTVTTNPKDATTVPGTDIKVPGYLGTPNPYEYSEGTKFKRDYGNGILENNYSVPQYYTGRSSKTSSLISGMEETDFTGIFGDNKFATLPSETSPEDLTKLQQQANLKTFDSLNRGGSFNIQTASDRPFGGPDPTTAFIQPSVAPLSDMSRNTKGNTIFRWA